MDVSVLNGFIIYQVRTENGRSMNLNVFRLLIVAEFIGAGKEEKSESLEQKINKYKPIVFS